MDSSCDRQSQSAKHPVRSAGAFGFTRDEIRAIVLIAVLAGSFTIAQWVYRKQSEAIPPWVGEALVLNAGSAATHTAGNSARIDNRTGERASTRININTADRDELILLPGIGPALADRIIAERATGGPFADLVDLQRVRGIGPRKAAALAGWIAFSATAGETTKKDTGSHR